MNAIEIHKLSKSYGKVQALQEVSFEVQQGELFGLIGPDGAEEFIRYYEKMPFLVLLIMLTSAHVAAIGCYKAFFLQARVSMIAGLLAIGFQIWLAIDFFRFMGQMTFSVTMLFPLAAAFLDFIAARASLVDEMTVQSIKAIKTKRRNRK